MRRSICVVEPSVSCAGEVSNWTFTYTTAVAFPKGTRIKFDLQSKGRVIDWQVPSTNVKEKGCIIWATLPNGKSIPAKELPHHDGLSSDFEFVLPSEIKAGEDFIIQMGTPTVSKSKEEGYGIRAQTLVQRRKRFLLYIDPKGKGDYKDPEIFTVDIRGNKLHAIQVIAPSIVGKNKRFDIMLRFEDMFGNLTNNAPEGTLIELTYEHLRENLSWKVFVPETGFLSLPNLYFNEPGIYRIQLQNLTTKQSYHSYPIKCFAEQDKSLLWGLLHGESDRVDSSENIEACLRHIRDEKSLQFFSTSSFESAEETPNELWKSISTHVAEFNEEGRFTSFLGMQWFGEDKEEGLRTLVFPKDNKPILRKKDPKTNNLKKMYKGFSPKECVAIPSFSMAKGMGTNFSEFTPEFERVVEIYNAWGSSECTEKEGNLHPITCTTKEGVSSWAEGSIRKALNNNCRFGFVAGGYDDRGIFSTLYDAKQAQYTPGLTGIFSIEQTRDAVFTALFQRQCYATTGERIILGFFIAGAAMGSELSTKAKPGLAYNRHITGYVAGTAPIEKIEIIRNGEVLQTLTPSGTDVDFAIDDAEMLHKAVLTTGKEESPFAYYYLRVLQKDGHMAWSSPIWVDMEDAPPAPAKKSKKKA